MNCIYHNKQGNNLRITENNKIFFKFMQMYELSQSQGPEKKRTTSFSLINLLFSQDVIFNYHQIKSSLMSAWK